MASFPPIQFKRSSTPGAAPVAADILVGEIALNLDDKAIYTKDAAGNIIMLARNYDSDLSFLDSDIRKAVHDYLSNDSDFDSEIRRIVIDYLEKDSDLYIALDSEMVARKNADSDILARLDSELGNKRLNSLIDVNVKDSGPVYGVDYIITGSLTKDGTYTPVTIDWGWSRDSDLAANPWRFGADLPSNYTAYYKADTQQAIILGSSGYVAASQTGVPPTGFGWKVFNGVTAGMMAPIVTPGYFDTTGVTAVYDSDVVDLASDPVNFNVPPAGAFAGVDGGTGGFDVVRQPVVALQSKKVLAWDSDSDSWIPHRLEQKLDYIVATQGQTVFPMSYMAHGDLIMIRNGMVLDKNCYTYDSELTYNPAANANQVMRGGDKVMLQYFTINI